MRRAVVLATIAALTVQTGAWAQRNAFGVPDSPPGDAPASGQPPQAAPPAGFPTPNPGFPSPEAAPFGGQPGQPPFGGQPNQPAFGGQPGQPPFSGQPGQPPYGSEPNQPSFGQGGPQYGAPPQYGQPPPPQYGQPGPSGPPMSIQQYLTSVWRGQTVDQTGAWNVVVAFKPDGTFFQQQALANGQFQLSLMGRYNVQAQNNMGVIQFYLQDWQPRQYCAGPQNCRPINLPRTQSVPFRPLGRDLFETEHGRFQRAGMAQ